MILAFSLTLLLWQGSFAQPQLDGRYGVDRVAMEKQAKEAAQPSCKACGKDVQGKDYCVPAECPSKAKPSYTCRDKSDVLLHSEDGKSHWCLKIEEAR